MESDRVEHKRKPDTPAIRPRPPDKSQILPEVKTKGFDLNKVIRLLQDPLTTNLTERHLFVLRKLLKRSQNGFLLKELTDTGKIISLCAEKAKDHPEYVPVLCEALKICRFPFLKEKISDELNYAQDVTHFLSHIGGLMRVPSTEVRQHLVESVKSFYASVAPKQLLDGLQPTSPGYRLQLLERSDLARSLLLSMAALQSQPALKLQLLHTLQILSSSSDMNCAFILSARGAETICLQMNEPDPSDQVLFRSSEILWNLLERGGKDEVTSQLSSIKCVLSLKEAFFKQLLNSFRNFDLRLRNDLLVITSLIAELPSSHLIESLFAKDLIAVIIFPELRSQNPLIHNLKLTYNNEDFKMKRLLLNMLVLMSKDLAAIKLYREERVMLALLALTRLPAASSEQRSGSHQWSSVQQEELQLQALAVLTTIAPLMLDDWMSCQGNACLLLLLDWCVGQDAYLGQGYSLSDGGGSSGKKAQMRQTIRVLRAVTFQGEESVNQDLCDQGIINQLLGILMQMEASMKEDDLVSLEIKSDIQLILSALCETDMHRKELFGSEGVEMAVYFLRKGCGDFYSGLGHNKLLLSTVDCVWSCIVGCYTTEDYFLAKEGAFLLLDLLNSSPKCVHGIILATLLELSDNVNTLSHILAWKAESGQTAPGLLLQMWRREEVALGVSRNLQGGLSDPKKPILTQHQQEETQMTFPADRPSAAVLEISENLRSKIYSIFCKLGFQELPGLTAEDYVTLTIVKRYLDFKVGEVWAEIGEELRAEGVRPVTPDQEALGVISGIAEDMARMVMAEESAILERQRKEDVGEEELMYREMKSYRNQEELAAKSWDSYVSRTSNYETLKKVKAQRESSRSKSEDEGATLHPAEHFIGRILNVETNDGQGPAGVKVTLARAPVRAAARDKVGLTRRDPEYFSTIPVID